ncbi:FMN-binding negative transcriptional regulator [Actinomadura parmotrematis]|uniref:FMN-binding negative transcriptional regulator n=1 Tax=Actinomadura parmotrematis TaxID=2864039 RepID=A0ABS7FRL3_9ACTN|nr:FMN-binding negative transcriptional regulator [Actinomadura parmotrematis]MBW8482187.1 FMN-binding negative transcriptional regulator [Actinomadura parmotrematis]
MLEQPEFAITDTAALRALVHGHGWVTMVAAAAGEAPEVSHLPVVLDPDDPHGLTVLGHLNRADPLAQRLGDHDAVLIVQGPDGYVPATFYEAGPYTPTWDFVVAHLYGRPEILGPDDTYRLLSLTVDHFEAGRPDPWRLSSVAGYAHRLLPGVLGFRMRPSRVAGKAKLSQDKPREVVDRVVRALRTDPVHRNPALADAVRAARP